MLSSLSRPRLAVRLLVALTVGLLAVPGLITPATAADAATGHLSGTVRDQQGKVVNKARVRLLDPATGAEIVSDTTVTSGGYSLNAPAGVYDLAVSAGPSVSPYTAVMRDITVPATATTFDVVVVRPDVTLRGKVVDGAGAPLSNVTVRLEGTGVFGPAVTAADGSFALGARPGIYALKVRRAPDRSGSEIEAYAEKFDLAEDRTETLRLPVTDIDVTARTDRGEPSPGWVAARCARCEIDGDLFPGAKARFTMSSEANLNGGTARLRGLPATNASVYASGSETLAELNKSGIDLTAPGGISLTQRTLDRTDKVRFRGQLTDQHGTPLDGYVTLSNDERWEQVELWEGRRDFEFFVQPGTYQLQLELNVATVWEEDGEHSHYTEGLFVTLDGLELTADRTQNLTVPIVDFPVHVVDADGNPSGGTVDGISGQLPGHIPGQTEDGNATIELFPGAVGHGMLNNSIGTDGGTAHLKVFPGAAPRTVTVTSRANIGHATPAKNAVEATVRLRRDAYINGAIRGTDGALAEAVRISVASSDDYTYSTTDTWNFTAPTGRYSVSVGNPYEDDNDEDFEPVPGPTRPARWSVDGDFDLVAGENTADLTIPDADHADIWLYGQDGRFAGRGVSIASSLNAGIVLAPGIKAWGFAESDPTGEVGHIRAPMFGPSTVQVSNDDSWRTGLASFQANPNDTIHVVVAVRGTEVETDPGVPSDPPATTTPDPGAGTATTTPAKTGYWALAENGQIYSFGDAAHHGNGTAGAVDLEPTPSGKGYWTLNKNGQIQAFGEAAKLGDVDMAKLVKGETPASLSATPTGKGYWVFTNRGRAIAFGDAPFLGDVSTVKLNGPVLGSVATPSGNGYYIVASDGGIFTFGDATFLGSMGGKKLNAPVQSLVPDSDGKGYWLVASDGGIFTFDAPFKGSLGSVKLNKPVVGMVRYGDGYLMVGADGGIFNFSSSPFAGSLGDKPSANPVVAVAALA